MSSSPRSRRKPGSTPELSTSGGTSDGRFLIQLCPVVDFGLPNATMHKVGECAAVEDIRALSRIYETDCAEGARLRRPTCAPRSALPIQARNSSSNIGWAKTKPWTVSQPIARRMSAWATVSTASATTSQPTPLISWMTAWTMTRAFSRCLDVGDQRRVELDPVERHRAQPGDVRIAGSEIVDRDASAVVAQRRDLGEHRLADFHRRALGEFQLDQRQRHVGIGEGLAQLGEEIGAIDLARADVESQSAAKPLRLPVAEHRGDFGHAPSRRSRR